MAAYRLAFEIERAFGSMDRFRTASAMMSIYRLSDRLPRSDVHAPSVDERRWASAAHPAASLVHLDTGDYRHLSKATPANRIFPRTAAWLASLPEQSQPRALVRRFPRIANPICAVWANQDFFHTY